MVIRKHIISSVPLGILYFAFSKDILSVFLAMVTSVIIDFDHILDFIITQKRIAPVKEMIQAFDTFKVVHKNYILLHSWELVIIFAISLIIYPHPYLFAVFAGYTYHLALDQIYNPLFLGKYNLKALFYFFFYRLGYKFDVLQLRKELPEDRDERIY